MAQDIAKKILGKGRADNLWSAKNGSSFDMFSSAAYPSEEELALCGVTRERVETIRERLNTVIVMDAERMDAIVWLAVCILHDPRLPAKGEHGTPSLLRRDCVFDNFDKKPVAKVGEASEDSYAPNPALFQHEEKGALVGLTPEKEARWNRFAEEPLMTHFRLALCNTTPLEHVVTVTDYDEDEDEKGDDKGDEEVISFSLCDVKRWMRQLVFWVGD
jgi:hypothetical protein